MDAKLRFHQAEARLTGVNGSFAQARWLTVANLFPIRRRNENGQKIASTSVSRVDNVLWKLTAFPKRRDSVRTSQYEPSLLFSPVMNLSYAHEKACLDEVYGRRR
jgi:hypothetical protein